MYENLVNKIYLLACSLSSAFVRGCTRILGILGCRLQRSFTVLESGASPDLPIDRH